MERLRRLLDSADTDCEKWLIGKIPHHYKRITCDKEEAMRLAIIGASEIGGYFNARLYFTQAVIAGSIISGDYDKITIVSVSQYGKSWLMGHVGLYQAYKGHPQYIAAATGDKTNIIMRHVIGAMKEASPEVQEAFLARGERLDSLARQLSKKRIASKDGGFVECVTLADTFEDKSRSQAIGLGGDYIIDEAALVSNEAFTETGRSEFAQLNDKKYMTIMISNPHNPGYFYDKLTGEVGDREIVIWMDACTAVEEGRWSKEHVLNSDFAKDKSTRIRYLLCELEQFGASMFVEPVVDDSVRRQSTNYIGVDAAYRGKDSICLARVSTGEVLRVEEVLRLNKGEWIDGVTSEDIIKTVANVSGTMRSPLTCVDIGFGVWLVEGLAKKGVSVKGINFGEGPTKDRVKAKHYSAVNASNMRAEMHLDLQNLMEEKAIVWSSQAYEMVKDIFPYVTCERKTSGKIMVRPKIEIKNELGRSPDELDAVLLAVHAAILGLNQDREYIT